MGAYNVVNPASLVAGQSEDISQVLANFNAIAALLNGGLDNFNIAALAGIAYSKLALANSIKASDMQDPGSNNLWLQRSGGVVNWGAPPGSAGATYQKKVTFKTVNTTIAETDLFNGDLTIAANPGTSATIRFAASGDWVMNNGIQNWPRLKLKLGATTLLDTGALTAQMGASATRFSWSCTGKIQNLGVANSQSISLHFESFTAANTSNQAAAFTTGEGVYIGGLASTTMGGVIANGFNTSAVDTTASQVLALSVILPSSSANVEMKLYDALVEIIP